MTTRLSIMSNQNEILPPLPSDVRVPLSVCGSRRYQSYLSRFRGQLSQPFFFLHCCPSRTEQFVFGRAYRSIVNAADGLIRPALVSDWSTVRHVTRADDSAFDRLTSSAWRAMTNDVIGDARAPMQVALTGEFMRMRARSLATANIRSTTR